MNSSNQAIASTPQSAAGTRARSTDPTFPERKSKVLIVDDESVMRRLAAVVLESIGIETRAAVNGFDAIQKLSADPGIDLVLLDLRMPVMDGEATFRELRKRWPAVRVVLFSGFTPEDIGMRFNPPEPEGFIQKPFTAAALREVVQDALHHTTASL